MTKLILTCGVAAMAFAQPILAQGALEDSDGNGAYSMEELLVAFPELTAETFTMIDVNGDEQVDGDEFAAAVEAGLLPA